MATNERNHNTFKPSGRLIACAVCMSEYQLQRCSRCKVIFYCSREHQKADWVRHKAECNNVLPSRSITGEKLNSISGESGEGTNNNDCKDSQQDRSDNTQEEINRILDFSNVIQPCYPSPQTKEESKQIFFDLAKSDSKDFAGPSDDTDASYSNIIDSLSTGELNLSHSQEGYELDVNSTTRQDEECQFDPSPFRRLKFPKPESYELSEIAEFVSLRLTQLGYCILDSALQGELLDNIICEVNVIRNRNEFCRGETLQGSNSHSFRKDMIKWLDRNSEGSKHICHALDFIDSIVEQMHPHLKKYCNIKGRTEALLVCYPEDRSYCQRQVDNEYKDGRCVTCTLYLNRDWDIERDGGLMRMFPPNQDKPVDVPPLVNRILFFWSDQRMPHEIHPTFRDRYSITVWYYDVDEKEAAKVKKLKQETEEIQNRITELEEQRRRLQEMTTSQQIQNRAIEAVQALTQGELQALSLLIDHHPNPKEALTAMGISEAIQDALIIHLSSLDSGAV